MPFFKKKPIRIEARFLDEHTGKKIEQWIKECGHDAVYSKSGLLHVDTLEGILAATPGDWVIKGVNGEFYSCKPDIFAKTYEFDELT